MPGPNQITRRNFLKYTTIGLSGLAGLAGLETFSASISTYAQTTNPIIDENNKPGSANWNTNKYASDTTLQIAGYASATSVNKGGSIDFHISVNPAQNYTVEIYRMGYYQGLGGRLMTTIPSTPGSHYTVPAPDSLGTVACTWPVAFTLTIPSDWTTGAYVAKLINAQGWQNYVYFVVRDDASTADLMFCCSVTTYQAYNTIGGKSLYPDDSAGGVAARKVSFDRPLTNYAASFFGSWELPALTFIEQHGYNVAYCTSIDLHTNPNLMAGHLAYLSTGHDEYWSKGMYDNALAFRNSGKHLAFLGANAVYWQIRFENSNRLIVCYKDYYKEDPVYIANPNSPDTTYLWRELPPGNASPGISRPENQLIGVMYNGYSNSKPNQNFVVDNSNHWVYAGTGFTNGAVVPGIVGYEWDTRFNNGLEPAGLVQLSNSPVVDDLGAHSFSNASIYQASSGAWVFASGTIFWSNGLVFNTFQTVDYHNAGIQRATTNILDRFISTSLVIDSVSPASVVQMENAFTLTVTGSNFDNTAVVNWNGSARPTTFVDSLHLTCQISATDILVAGSYPVSVSTSGGASSKAVTFHVTVPKVTNPKDGGEAVDSGNQGTLSYALKHVHGGDTILFNLAATNRIDVSGKLPDLPQGITLDGGNCGGTQIIINGSGVNANGLVLGGNVKIRNLKIQGFASTQVVNKNPGTGVVSGGNQIVCSTISKG